MPVFNILAPTFTACTLGFFVMGYAGCHAANYFGRLRRYLRGMHGFTAELPELTDGEVKELQLTTQCYAFARVLDGKACVVVLNNGDSPAQLEFQLPVEASSAKDLLADTVGAQPVLTSMEWGRMKVQLPSNYATILQLE